MNYKITIKEEEKGGGVISKNNSPNMTHRQATVLKNLPVNLQIFVELLQKEREIKAEQFIKLLKENNVDLQNTRQLRLYKEELIKAGFPIGSHNSRGYFFINNDRDRADAVSEYKSKAFSMLKIANKINENTVTYHKLTPEQMTIFEINERRV